MTKKNKQKSIDKMTDEECLQKFIELMEERVTLNTNFVIEQETGHITHQILSVECGEYRSHSQPEPLEVVLRPATAEELGVVNN